MLHMNMQTVVGLAGLSVSFALMYPMLSRNVIFLLPGANVAAVFLEARTLSRDQQGLRLGDRLAMTQVVDGYGAKDLALDIQALLENSATQLGVSTGRRRRRAP